MHACLTPNFVYGLRSPSWGCPENVHHLTTEGSCTRQKLWYVCLKKMSLLCLVISRKIPRIPSHENPSCWPNLCARHIGFIENLLKVLSSHKCCRILSPNLVQIIFRQSLMKVIRWSFYFRKSFKPFFHYSLSRPTAKPPNKKWAHIGQSLVNWHETCCECLQPCAWHNDFTQL